MPGTTIDRFLISKANTALRRLKKAGLSVVTAESCTAGLIAAVLARGIGASDILHGGFVAYTKKQKKRGLGVSLPLLKKEGSVTAAVSEAMAKGALKRSEADIAIAVTGVLGPTCDEDGNPVGLVFISCARKGGSVVTREKHYGRQAHDRLRKRTVIEALELLRACAKAR